MGRTKGGIRLNGKNDTVTLHTVQHMEGIRIEQRNLSGAD